jgi:hypothetical protein
MCCFTGDEPDGAGAAELAEQLWIATFEADLAQVDLVLAAEEAGFAVGVVDAGRHIGLLGQY